MSALLAPLDGIQPSDPDEGTGSSSRPALRSVQVNPMRASRAVFMIVLLAILGSGMVGVLVLNTSIQQRSMEVSAVQRTADDLGARNASLNAQAEQLRSSSELASRAWTMGMRPNPYPVFIQLGADGAPGHIIGTPKRVTGNEVPDQMYVGADQVTTDIEKARAAVVEKRKAAEKAARERAAARVAAAKAAAEAQKKAVAAQQAAKAAQQKAAAAKAAAQKSSGGH